MPGMYQRGEYDLAGFSVGIVGRKKIVDGKRVVPGDVAIGLPSSGLHSNGYSLARKVIETSGLALADRPAELGGKSIAEALLAPTRLYARHVLAMLAAGVDVRAMSHITGGGIPGNLPRVLPDGLGVAVAQRWPRAPIFDLLEKRGPVTLHEMRRTFNAGVGFVFVVARADAERASATLAALGESPIRLGDVVALAGDVAFEERVVWEPA